MGKMPSVLDRIEKQYETMNEDLRRAMAMGVRPVQLWRRGMLLGPSALHGARDVYRQAILCQ